MKYHLLLKFFPTTLPMGYLGVELLPFLLVDHSYEQIEGVRDDVGFTTPCGQVRQDLVQQVGYCPLATISVMAKGSSQG